MTDEEMILLGQIRNKVKEQPEFLNHIVSAGVHGAIDRGYDEKTDTYEPIELFLRGRVNWFVEQISKIKVKEE